jgi:endonuclease YncB( thermonuclease family)
MRWLTLSVAVAGLLPLASFASDHLSGKVVGITDGDTLTVLVDREPVKVRPLAASAPPRSRGGSRCRPLAPARRK